MPLKSRGERPKIGLERLDPASRQGAEILLRCDDVLRRPLLRARLRQEERRAGDVESGGETVRRRNGEATRTRSSSFPASLRVRCST